MAELNIDQRLGNIERLLQPVAPKVTAIVDHPTSPGQAHELNLNASQSADWAKSLIASGVDPALVAKALAGEGHAPLAAADPRTADEVEFDDTFAAVKPDAFKMEFGNREVSDETRVAFTKEAGAAVAGMGFNAALGKAFVMTSLDHSDELRDLTPDQRTTWAATEAEKLDQYCARHALYVKDVKDVAKIVLEGAGDWGPVANQNGALQACDLVVMRYLQGLRTLARDDLTQARPKAK